MAFMRRKRLPDGSFGELEKVGSGETTAETIARLTAENELLKADGQMTLEAIAEIYEIIGGGA